MSSPRILHLALKGEYFDQIAVGTKSHEYRLHTPYWAKRLIGREYDEIHITRGYPAANDESRRLRRKWAGYQVQMLTHPHFGPEPVRVYAIDVTCPAP